jgi:hypothetical protein
MSNPILTINNAAKRAQEGLGDGTVFASATGTSNTVDDAQTNKRLTFVAFTPIADLPAGSDDQFNSYVAVAVPTGTVYTVTDWVESTKTATVDEVPAAEDVGTGKAWDLRRTLYCPDADAAFPIHRAVNGFPAIKAKIRDASVALTIDAHLPNLVGQGGFEELPVAAFPSTVQVAGKWWASSTDWQVTAAAAGMYGSRKAEWVPGSDSQNIRQLPLLPVGGLKKGKTYRVIMKVQSVTGATGAGCLQVFVINDNGNVNLDADWGTNGVWVLPAIGTGAAWVVSPDFVPDVDSDSSLLRLMIVADYANRGATTEVRIDEVSFWEVVPVSSLLAFGHNWDGSPGPLVRGYYASPSRDGITSADYVDLLAAAAVSGSGPLRRTWTIADPPTSAQAFPIYRIQIAAHASFQYEVGELLLGQSFPLTRAPKLGMDPQARDYQETIQRTLSGAETVIVHSEPRVLAGTIPAPAAAELAVWNGAFRERHYSTKREPFGVYWPDHWPDSVLMRCHKLGTPHQFPLGMPNPADVEIEFREAL